MEVPGGGAFLLVLQKAGLLFEGLTRLAEGQGAAGHSELQWRRPWRVPAARSEYAVSNGVHYSPCKLKIKINQTLKLISFPSVCSAVPVRCLPARLVQLSPTPGQGWAAQVAAEVPAMSLGAAGTSFPPWEIR